MSTKSFKRRVEPLEHVVHPEGNIVQEKWKEASGPLEHVLRLEGHVAQGNR
jgi:hypothetical protein